MLTRYALILFLSLSAFAQVDFSILPSTRPFTMGDPAPATCQQGQMFSSTTAALGANLFICGVNNDWAVVGSGTPAVLAAVATSGNYGDLLNIPTFSKAAMSGLYTDLLNAPAFLLPSGNAASATKLAATPVACLAGRYAISITATGNANCAQVLYSQLGGIPAAYALPQATTTLLGGIKAGTGLSSTLGVLAVKYGTVAGTAAQGNDSRILGALQKATGLAALGLTGLTPVTINSPTTGNAATATRAFRADTLQGAGLLRMKGPCGAFPFVVGGPSAPLGVSEMGAWFNGASPADCNFQMRDQANLNRSTMVYTWKNGVEQKATLPVSALTDITASGVPVYTQLIPFQTPASSADTCVKGQMSWDANYMYVCVDTNLWRRSAMTDF